MSPATRTASVRRFVAGQAVNDRLALGAVALLAIVMRFWALGSRPGYDWDEPVYANIGTSVATGHGLYLKAQIGAEHTPYLYHPPFYFWLLGGWMRLFGTGITSARYLGATMSVIVLGLLYTLLRRRWGTLALVPLAVIATDGWLVFSNRVSWIENSMMVLAAATILVYDRALRSGRRRDFVIAGALAGATFCFKHVGIYIPLAILCSWVVVRRDHRSHLALLGTTAGVIGVYLVGMSIGFGHAYWAADQVQLERLTGHKESRGSIHGTGQVVSALIGPYKVYAVTLILSGVSLLLVAWRALGFLRGRAIADPVLFGWAAAAAITFAASGLKMAHYFMMIEIPLLVFLASEAIPRIRRGNVRLAIVVLIALLAANFATFDLRFVSRDDNALAQVADYAQTRLPAGSVILTEETIGSIVPQDYCKFFRVSSCGPRADYVITYTSRTQAPPDDPKLQALIAASTPVKVFKGFKETITVYATPRTTAAG